MYFNKHVYIYLCIIQPVWSPCRVIKLSSIFQQWRHCLCGSLCHPWNHLLLKSHLQAPEKHSSQMHVMLYQMKYPWKCDSFPMVILTKKPLWWLIISACIKPVERKIFHCGKLIQWARAQILHLTSPSTACLSVSFSLYLSF